MRLISCLCHFNLVVVTVTLLWRTMYCLEHDSSDNHTHSDASLALHTIFSKYGSNGTLSFEAFEHLLHSLGLGNIAYLNHDIGAHRQDNETFSLLHPHHEHWNLIDDHSSDSHYHHHHDHDVHEHSFPDVANLVREDYVAPAEKDLDHSSENVSTAERENAIISLTEKVSLFLLELLM